ncbi:hypothetical protein Btru_076509 [Bulinus truncatus]|nr:hypothetical protein Btru_076509 [Bulinus truncatus]
MRIKHVRISFFFRRAGGKMEEEIRLASLVIQSQEKLLLLIKENSEEKVKELVTKCLDSLKEQKSCLEKSNNGFISPKICTDDFVELKQLMLMHTPSSLTDDSRTKITKFILSAFKDHCKTIVAIVLLTCPWYELSKRERGEQAKHNILYVIFISQDEHFFSPVNSHFKAQASVFDEGWLCAVELSHFGQALAKANPRCLEVLHARDGADVFSSQEWRELKKSLDFLKIAGTSTFQQACIGQALAVGKKKKDGAFRLQQKTTLFQLCNSFRLCQLVEKALNQNANKGPVFENDLSSVEAKSMSLIRASYDHSEPLKCKQELFDLLMQWIRDLKAETVNKTAASIKTSNKILGTWLMTTRLQGRKPKLLPALSDAHSQLLKIMQEIGGPVASMKPEQIVLVTIAGSALYNLKVPGSDVDYLVVYVSPVETILSATSKIQESYESRGQKQSIEYGAYEARAFSEMLLKCSVIILELLFSDDHFYSNYLWKELSKEKRSFVTEKAIDNYMGLIVNNMKAIESEKFIHSAKRDRKLFYQIFHKLHCLQFMMNGEVPPIRLDGQMRDFIMNVRTRDDGEWSRENLLIQIRQQFEDIREKLAYRENRQKENPDYNVCLQWLMLCRGL